MKKWKLILLLLVTLQVSAQNKYNEAGKREGDWKGYYASNNLKYEGTFSNGKETGIFTYYEDSPERKIKATRDFTKDPNKNFAIFYFEGKKMSEGWYKNQQKVGKWVYYHKGGIDVMSEETYKNGLLDGERVVYYQNGKKSEVEPYKNGKLDGKAVMYSEKGVLLKEENYVNGKREGWSIYYKSDGSLLKKGLYHADELSGKWITEE